MLPGSVLAASWSVQIKNFAFNPATTNVSAGDTVTWVNLDPTAHRVHWTGNQFPDSADLQQSQAYAVTFTVPGAYGYICGIHPQMQGVVNVQRTVATPTPTVPPRTSAPPPPTASPTPSPTPSPSESPTPSPTSSPTAAATVSASPSPSPTQSASATPLASPAVQTNTFIGVALIAVGMSILVGALWWRFGRA